MFFTQAILILFRINYLFASEPYDATNWLNTLHVKNGAREVVSAEWYLSNERKPETEYKEFKSTLLSEEGKLAACEFPARFKVIRKLENLKTDINLENCHDLNQFKNYMRKKYVSLAITSEHMNAPASAFGHNMLIFHDEKAVELDANVVHFSALTNNENPLRYVTNGLSGIYSGYFFYEPFFKKLNEYSDIEQRSIYIHELKLSEEQKELLLDHLFELKKARFRYYFATKNCGYQLSTLLDFIYGSQTPGPRVYFLPIEALYNHKSNLEKSITITPLASKAHLAINKLRPEDRNNFATYIKGENPSPVSLSPDTKKALYLYNKYLFRSERIITPNYDEIASVQFENNSEDNFNSESLSPLEQFPPKKIYVETVSNNKDTGFVFGFRPVLIDERDFQNHKNYESSFNILKTEFSYLENTFNLKEVDVLDLKLMTPSKPFFRTPSWYFNLSLNRDNREQFLSPSISLGVGHTQEWAINTSLFAGTGFDLEDFEKGKPMLQGLMNNIFYSGKNFKFFQESKIKIYTEGKSFITHEVTLIQKLKDFDFYVGYLKTQDDRLRLGIDYHF